MDRMKTFLKYAILIIVFFFFSNFIINVGINSSYKEMYNNNNIPQGVEIIDAESTLVNGKVKGNIDTKQNKDLIGKYLKLDFYSKKGNLMGTKYITITEANEDEKQQFSTYFELQDVTSYNTSITDKKDVEEIKFIPEEMKKRDIIIVTILALLIFWG